MSTPILATMLTLLVRAKNRHYPPITQLSTGAGQPVPLSRNEAHQMNELFAEIENFLAVQKQPKPIHVLSHWLIEIYLHSYVDGRVLVAWRYGPGIKDASPKYTECTVEEFYKLHPNRKAYVQNALSSLKRKSK